MKTTTIGQLWKHAGWRAALTILLGSRELSEDIRVWRHVDAERHVIGFDEILADTSLALRERRLLEVAASLFTPDTRVSLRSAFDGLDERDRRLVVVALCSYGQVSLPEAHRRQGGSAGRTTRKRRH